MAPQSISVIISTYNNPEWLEKTLWGYEVQTFTDFEIIIADDGSGEPTANLIKQFQNQSKLSIKHIWHADNGFQKCEILNKAIVASNTDYLIFTDQDCIPRQDFVARHRMYAKKGCFLSGGYFKLPMDISKQACREDIMKQNIFKLRWLHQNGLKRTFKETKLFKSNTFSVIMNCITPAKASWNGMNSSCWRSDALRINGFNTQMRYGGEDREFGERLMNAGIKSRQLRYSLVCVHLNHSRPYKNEEAIAKNKQIRKETKEKRLIETPCGIRQSK